MKIIKPYARLLPMVGTWMETVDAGDGIECGRESESFTLDMGVSLMRHIEWCARISHRSEDAVTADSWKKIIEQVVMKHGDWSVVEHATVSVDMVVDRGITHEWVRHRLNAFTQESTRFVNYEKKMPPSFIYPIVGVECEFCLAGKEAKERYNGGGHWSFEHIRPEPHYDYVMCVYNKSWMEAILVAERQYKALLAAGWRPQEARSVFPNALASRIITTSNLRNWRHMFIMRTSMEAHPQMRQVMIPLLEEFKKNIPLLFDDLQPEQKQSEAMKRAR